MRVWLDALLAVVLAPVCPVCRRPLEQPTGGPVCAACWSAILPLTPPLCRRCGDALASWRAADLDRVECARCRRVHGSVAGIRAIGGYVDPLRSIVQALKYDARRSVAAPLGALMRERGASVLHGADAVVPVPLHITRRISRGFNQADDLARHLGPRVVPALRRTRATRDQVTLPSARRHANVRGAFAATAAARDLRGGIVVVVDDVYTTGATLEACAAALKHAGVREVRGLTAARVPARPR